MITSGFRNVALGVGELSDTSGHHNVFIGCLARPADGGWKHVVPDEAPRRELPMLRCDRCGGGVSQDALKCVHCGAPPPGLVS